MRVNSMTTKLFLPPKLDDRDNYKQTFRRGIKATKLNKKKKEEKKSKKIYDQKCQRGTWVKPISSVRIVQGMPKVYLKKQKKYLNFKIYLIA